MLITSWQHHLFRCSQIVIANSLSYTSAVGGDDGSECSGVSSKLANESAAPPPGVLLLVVDSMWRVNLMMC